MSDFTQELDFYTAVRDSKISEELDTAAIESFSWWSAREGRRMRFVNSRNVRT